MDLQRAAQKLGIPDLIERLRSTSDVVPIIDATTLTLDDFFIFPDKMPADKIPDLNSITGGSFTIGSGGTYDYLLWSSFASDISAVSTALTGTQKTATAETSAVVVGSSIVYLNGINLTLTTDTPHLGSFNKGLESTYNGTNGHFINLSGNSAFSTCNIIVSGLRLKRLASGATAYAALVCGSAIINALVSDVIVDLGGFNQGGIQAANASNMSLYNCLVINGKTDSGNSYGVMNNSSGGTRKIENCTVYGVRYGVWAYAGTAAFLNMVSFGNSVYDYTYGTTPTNGGLNGQGTDCASVDTTGTTGLTGMTASNELISLTSTNQNAYKPFRGRSLGKAGGAPGISQNKIDIAGNPRGRGRYYGLGAFEVKSHDGGMENGLERALHRGID
jgi:hypothetical protein